jgi:hypothetical protein
LLHYRTLLFSSSLSGLEFFTVFPLFFKSHSFSVSSISTSPFTSGPSGRAGRPRTALCVHGWPHGCNVLRESLSVDSQTYSLRNTKEKLVVCNLCISLVHGNPIAGAPSPSPPCRQVSRFQRRQVSRSVPPYCGKQLPLLLAPMQEDISAS